MSYIDPIEIVENDVLVVAVQGADGRYFMWQKGLTKEAGSDDGVYFEFNDQINGSFNQVKKCTVTNEGIHVMLSNGNSERFRFLPNFNKLEELQVGLKKIYAEQGDIVEFSI